MVKLGQNKLENINEIYIKVKGERGETGKIILIGNFLDLKYV